MDSYWLMKATTIGCTLCGLVGGIIGWLMYTEDDQET